MLFPRALRWALVAPFVIFVVTFVAAKTGTLPTVFFAQGGTIVLWMVCGAVALVAVAIALLHLVRAGPYLTAGNAALTFLGAIPVVICLAIGFVLVFGHFHI